MKFFINNKQFSKIILANTISRFGDSIDMIAFSWLIYSITKSASWSAIIMGVNQIVSVIFLPFVGSFVENKNKRKTMFYSDLVRFILIMLLCLLSYNNLINKWILLVFTIFISFVEAFRLPAGVSIIPMILSDEDYDEGISLNNALSKSSELIGLLASGFIISQFSSMGAIFIDGLTFLISAIFIFLIKYDDTSVEAMKNDNIFLKTKNGLSFLIKHKQLLLICIICSCLNACLTPFESLKAAYINLYFGANAKFLSVIAVSSSLGMIFGSFTYKYIAKIKFLQEKERILSFGGVGFGLFYIGTFLIAISKYNIDTKIILAIILTAIYGLLISYLNSYVQIFFVKNVKQEYLSRISAIAATINTIGTPISAFIIAFIATFLLCKYVLLLVGIVTIFLFLILSKKLNKSMS